MRVQALIGAALVVAVVTTAGFYPGQPKPDAGGGQSATGGGDTQSVESIVIEWPGEPIEVESLLWADGKVRTISKVPFKSTPATISFRRSPSTYLRFLRPDQSPVTLPTLALPKERLRLPLATAGGELIVRQPTALVLPTKYALVRQGETIEVAARGFGSFSIQGLSPGRYLLRGEYPGGLRAAEVEVSIASSQSVFVRPLPEAVGGISLSVSDERCLRTQELRISVVAAERGSLARSAPIVKLPHNGICSREIGGLPPGTYRVEFVDLASGLSMLADVDVLRQHFAQTAFTRPLPWINGSVTLRETAFPNVGASIVFRATQPDASRASVTVPVQAAGAFSLWLPEAGTYRVNVNVGGMILLGSQKVVTVHGGANQVDWNIDGSLVTVKVVDWDRSGPLSLELLRSSGRTTIGEPVSTEWRLEPASATLPLGIPGLAAGSYNIRAWMNQRGKEPVVSDVVRFDIEADDLRREVELVLRPHTVRVVLRDQTGAPVGGAAVDSYQGELKETERGVYVSGRTPVGPGSSIDISASGFTPVCTYAPGSGTLEVTLRRGVTQVVQFVGDPALLVPQGAIVWPGSDCSVPLSKLPTTLVARDGDSRTVTFEIRNFPLVPGLTWSSAAGRAPAPVVADNGGVVRLVVSRREER